MSLSCVRCPSIYRTDGISLWQQPLRAATQNEASESLSSPLKLLRLEPLSDSDPLSTAAAAPPQLGCSTAAVHSSGAAPTGVALALPPAACPALAAVPLVPLVPAAGNGHALLVLGVAMLLAALPSPPAGLEL